MVNNQMIRFIFILSKEEADHCICGELERGSRSFVVKGTLILLPLHPPTNVASASPSACHKNLRIAFMAGTALGPVNHFMAIVCNYKPVMRLGEIQPGSDKEGGILFIRHLPVSFT